MAKSHQNQENEEGGEIARLCFGWCLPATFGIIGKLMISGKAE